MSALFFSSTRRHSDLHCFRFNVRRSYGRHINRFHQFELLRFDHWRLLGSSPVDAAAETAAIRRTRFAAIVGTVPAVVRQRCKHSLYDVTNSAGKSTRIVARANWDEDANKSSAKLPNLVYSRSITKKIQKHHPWGDLTFDLRLTKNEYPTYVCQLEVLMRNVCI